MFKKYFLLLLTGIIFGSQFIITKYAIEGYTPLEVGMLRVVFGMVAVALLTPMFSKKREKKLNVRWYHYAVIGFLEGTLPCILLPWGQQNVPTGIAAVIISTMPIFAMILGPFFIKSEKFHWVNMVTILAGFFGVYLLINPGASGNWLAALSPEIAILLASASWALSLILIKKLPHESPFVLTRNILIAATIEIIPIWLIFGEPSHITFSMIPLINAILLGALSSGIVYVFYVLLIRLSGVNFAAFSNYLVPIIGVGIGVLFLNEKFVIQQLVGFAVIIFALVFQGFHEHWYSKKVK